MARGAAIAGGAVAVGLREARLRGARAQAEASGGGESECWRREANGQRHACSGHGQRRQAAAAGRGSGQRRREGLSSAASEAEKGRAGSRGISRPSARAFHRFDLDAAGRGHSARRSAAARGDGRAPARQGCGAKGEAPRVRPPRVGVPGPRGRRRGRRLRLRAVAKQVLQPGDGGSLRAGRYRRLR